jgi:hypothetical protein
VGAEVVLDPVVDTVAVGVVVESGETAEAGEFGDPIREGVAG